LKSIRKNLETCETRFFTVLENSLLSAKENKSGKSYKRQDIYRRVTKAFVSIEENKIYPSDLGF
jgi:hypothetical protein